MTLARFSLAIQLIVGKSVTCNRIFLRKCARWSSLLKLIEQLFAQDHSCEHILEVFMPA